MPEKWMLDLASATRDSKIRFESIEQVTNEAHAHIAAAVLRAFGDSPIGFVFAEARTPDRSHYENARPSDVLLLHPEIGALFIEVKGWVIDEIVDIEAGTFHRHVAGREERANPWMQAQNAASQLKKATEKVVRRSRSKSERGPFFEWLVALPNIAKADWEQRSYDRAIHSSEVLLADDLHDTAQLRARLVHYITAKSGRKAAYTPVQLAHVREALGSTEVINQRRQYWQRINGVEEKLGDKINRMELQTKRLSPEQRDLINDEFDGRPQLVRGVAGSGKSVVLAKNLAAMIDRYENSEQLSFTFTASKKRFAIVCFNQTLVPFLRQKFEDAYQEIAHKAPTVPVDIFHFNGLMYHLSTRFNRPLNYQLVRSYRDTPEAPKALQIAQNYLAQCNELAARQPKQLDAIQYDAIYVDEGQDLFEEEYLCLMHLLKPTLSTKEKNIVIFYDDAQNLYGRPRPTWNKLGIQITGRRTSAMKICFRNTRQIIEFAFNLLLGVKAETRVTTKQFADVAFLRENNLAEELHDRWLVNFADRDDGEHPEVVLFSSREEELHWLENRICTLIEQQAVRPQDILLITQHPSRLSEWADALPQKCAAIHRILKPFGDGSNPAKQEYIFGEGAITLASVEAAKGYDCPIVFVIAADIFPMTTEGRAHFYVAATRAKFHLIVTGLNAASTLAVEAQFVSALLQTPVTPQEQIPAPIAEPAEEITFHAGDLVQHPTRGKGRVLADAIPHELPSQNRYDQGVHVQFADKEAYIVAGLAGLQLLEKAN